MFGLHANDGIFSLGTDARHLFSHVENDLDPREVDAELVDEPADLLELLDILGGEVANVAASPLRLDQPDALVMTQGLLVHVDDVGGHADREPPSATYGAVRCHGPLPSV